MVHNNTPLTGPNIDVPRSWRWLLEEEIAPEDLPELVSELIDLVGLPGTFRFLELFGGTSVYVPTPERSFAAARNLLIRRLHDGTNKRDLARRFNLTTVTIRKILRPTHDRRGPGE